MLRIFLTGATGFVGSAVLDELLARGHQVHAFVHRRAINREGVRNFTEISPGLEGCNAVIHLVGIIAEKPRQGITFREVHVRQTVAVVEAAKRNGVKRIIHMSALGARPGAPSEYHRTKYEAEQVVRESGLDWTIIRPSMIHGPRGEFTQMMIAWSKGKAAPFLFMPYFSHSGKIQPIFVNDVARAFVDALGLHHTIGEVYPLAGPDILEWPEMYKIFSRTLTGKEKAVRAIPCKLAMLMTKVAPASLLPFNKAQVQMSQEDNICNLMKFAEDFGWVPGSYESTIQSYLRK